MLKGGSGGRRARHSARGDGGGVLESRMHGRFGARGGRFARHAARGEGGAASVIRMHASVWLAWALPGAWANHTSTPATTAQ